MDVSCPPTETFLYRVKHASARAFHALEYLADDNRLPSETRDVLTSALKAVEAIQEHLGTYYDDDYTGSLFPKEVER